jgi:hypothetical protein
VTDGDDYDFGDNYDLDGKKGTAREKAEKGKAEGDHDDLGDTYDLDGTRRPHPTARGAALVDMARTE